LAASIGFICGVVVTWLAWAWRHRKLIITIVDWAMEAAKDGKITWEEFAILCERMGKIAREYACKRGVSGSG
ncbi:MAG: hypothetical protein DRP01_10680, partial [Archaeoglobales archaeon]